VELCADNLSRLRRFCSKELTIGEDSSREQGAGQHYYACCQQQQARSSVKNHYENAVQASANAEKEPVPERSTQVYAPCVIED
jgi:hypothetical protein